ncbi:MAG: copper homeostasis periplasmic binding protein CopC [Sphingobium sp.]|nr:copper homeostasis periplasmic binding protein CopC [Sphingobium sp.]
MKFSKAAAAIGTLALLIGAAPAFSHAKLISSTPAAGATASGVKTVTLTFDDALMAPLSGLDIVMGAMPGMAAMKMTGVKVKVGSGGKSLVATLAKPLPAGSYDVNWHVVSDDNHRITGKVSFTVK